MAKASEARGFRGVGGTAAWLTLHALLAIGAPGSAAAQVACGAVVEPGTKVVLTADVGPCDDVAAAIIVESASLDLGGHTVSCADTNGDGELPDGVVLRGLKARVFNGTVVGCFDNVVAAGAGRHRVESVTAREAAEDGIYVPSTSSGNQIVGNSAVSNYDDGMLVRGSRNRLVGNVSQGNGEDGIDLSYADNNVITKNTTTGNGDDGIEVSGVRNKIAGNTVHANAGFGIVTLGARNRVIGNIATGSGAWADIAGAGPCSATVWKKNTYGSASSCVR
jgi:parallel beta-helix repeat protein